MLRKHLTHSNTTHWLSMFFYPKSTQVSQNNAKPNGDSSNLNSIFPCPSVDSVAIYQVFSKRH
jgi:hypothetical protein